MSISDRKRLWGRSGNRCAFPECDRRLTSDMQEYVNDAEADQGVTLGEEAHIIAESGNGPRANPKIPQQQRDAYENRILLCEEHHKVIDTSNGRFFSVEVLMEMKREHESAVSRSMDKPSKDAEEAAERAARFVADWEQRIDLEHWDSWTSWLLTPSPTMERDRFDRFSQAAIWLGSREWPTSHFPKIRQSGKLFTEIWRDLVGVIDREFSDHRILRERFCLREKHKEIEWDEDLYKRYGDEYDFNCDLIHELIFHLTASANLLCSRVREELDANYRFDAGKVVITRGPNEQLRFEHFSPTYESKQLASGAPYPGIDELRAHVARSAHHRP